MSEVSLIFGSDPTHRASRKYGQQATFPASKSCKTCYAITLVVRFYCSKIVTIIINMVQYTAFNTGLELVPGAIAKH